MRKMILCIAGCILILSSHISYAAGLSTSFGEVRVDNIQIGQVYSMQGDANAPLVIKNTSDEHIVLRIDVVMPNPQNIEDGYEAIPSKDWVRVEVNDFVMPPQSEVSTDVIINIPYDGAYLGKSYQVDIWSRTIGEALGVGLKSKLLISIAE